MQLNSRKLRAKHSEARGPRVLSAWSACRTPERLWPQAGAGPAVLKPPGPIWVGVCTPEHSPKEGTHLYWSLLGICHLYRGWRAGQHAVWNWGGGPIAQTLGKLPWNVPHSPELWGKGQGPPSGGSRHWGQKRKTTPPREVQTSGARLHCLWRTPSEVENYIYNIFSLH